MKFSLLLFAFWSSQTMAIENTSLRIVRGLSIGSMVADWSQTRWLSKNHDKGYKETNPILGEYPSTRRVDLYFLSLLSIQSLLNIYGNEYTKWHVNLSVLVTHGLAAKHNYSIGIKFYF